jgi:hypothetical protein
MGKEKKMEKKLVTNDCHRSLWRSLKKEGGRAGERESGREGERERGRAGEREKGREGEREQARERGREGKTSFDLEPSM